MSPVMPELKSHRGLAAAAVPPAPGESVRLPIHFFAIAIFSFALGTATAPWAAVKLADYFYQLSVLSWVHTFTLGWITSAMLGVMYRYVPAMTQREIRYPRLARVQLVLYFLGASGVVAHFMLGSWDGVWMAGAVVAVSVVLFAINIVPCMTPDFGRGVAETGMLMALFFLLCASSLGALLAFDKGRGFMPGTLLRNLSAHAHLAVLGWVTLTVCAVSYRFLTAIMVSPKAQQPQVPRSAMVQIFALAGATIALFLGLFAGLGNVTVWTVAVAAAMAAYLTIFERILRNRSAADWTVRHALAGAFCLLLAIVSGVYLAIVGAGSPFGAHLVCAYGILGLLGWVSNFIVGMSYTLFTGFVVRVRLVLGWPNLGVSQVSVKGGRPLVFGAFNGGVLLMAGGLLSGQSAVAQAGAYLIALGGLVYSAMMAWTLSFAYRRGAPTATDRMLRAAPN
jgi:hypothetical protein